VKKKWLNNLCVTEELINDDDAQNGRDLHDGSGNEWRYVGLKISLSKIMHLKIRMPR